MNIGVSVNVRKADHVTSSVEVVQQLVVHDSLAIPPWLYRNNKLHVIRSLFASFQVRTDSVRRLQKRFKTNVVADGRTPSCERKPRAQAIFEIRVG